MAKNDTQTVARTPVTLTGVALLQALVDAGGSMNLTQDEGAAIVAAGQATVSGTPNEDGTATVTITDAGKAAIAAASPAQKAAITRAPVAITPGVRTDIPIPAITRRAAAGSSKYPFDTMEVGASFHVPATAANDKPLASIQSSLSQARDKYAVETDQEETVTVTKYKVDAKGTRIKDADGHWIKDGEETVTRKVKKYTKNFYAAAVGADDPNGAGARVWRTE